MKRTLPLLMLLLPLLGCPSSEAARNGASSDARAAAQAVPVRTAEAARVDLVRSIELGGIAEAWRSARLAPAGQGIVQSLPAQLGDVVRKGDLLAELDNSTLKLQLAQAEKASELARLQLRDARREADRAEQLEASGAITGQQIDQARAGLQLAEAQVASTEASLLVLRDQIAKSTLRAPFDGTITGVFLEQGEFFTAMAGMGGPPALVSLDSLDTIKLDVNLPDVDLARVQAGMRVLVACDALPDGAWEGEVAVVGAAANAGSRTFTVRVRIPNPEGALRPGLFLRARLVLQQEEGVLAIPQAAVTEPDGEPFVMVLDGELARRKPISLGLKGDEGWAVEGIQPGDRVIVEGQFGLPDGAHVRVID